MKQSMTTLLLTSSAIGLACLVHVPSASAANAVAHIEPTSNAAAGLQGEVSVAEESDGLTIHAVLRNAPPGVHGFHIHQYGDCSNGGKAAGGHFNPDSTKHGDFIAEGPANAHAGDLGNITVDASGNAERDISVKTLGLSGGHYGIAGRAFILHEKADDFGQPTGNAGGRIACGAIVFTE